MVLVIKSLSSTPTKRLSFSKGADENDQNYQGSSLNVQSPKETTNNNSNEAFYVINNIRSFKSIGFGEYEENALLLDHLSSRPYDPLTNYISPRPTFLRYKPHRLRDIFLRRENEAREESSSCCGGSVESNNDKDVEDELGTSSLADGT
ncbi:hypothetical protein OIU76_018535 [Salix suchowensis]|nr:hypothetical protein OIU76_018535 [Salix suchowensis]